MILQSLMKISMVYILFGATSSLKLAAGKREVSLANCHHIRFSIPVQLLDDMNSVSDILLPVFLASNAFM
ncbi:hypothetical protein BT93_G0902 [Corymbia citriodora subsp. variegata]|nr:hypothetical protein BT93_G0902 [Corymbia citriodora subsp. variegata]